MFYLYKITNVINGKVYIGQTKDFDRRMSQHRRCSDKTPLYLSRDKYGWDNFTKEIIAECSEDMIDAMEAAAISFYKSMDREFGYNLDSGGYNRKVMSEEARRKMSLAHKGKPSPKKGIKSGYIPWNKGKTMSEEQKKKLSDAHRGKGHPHSEDAKKRISETIKNHWAILSDEDKNSRLHNFIHYKRTSEIRNKMSNSAKQRGKI